MVIRQRVSFIQTIVRYYSRPSRLRSQLLSREISDASQESQFLPIPSLPPVSNAVAHSFTERIIMNTLNKAQLLIMQTDLSNGPEYDSLVEKYTLKDLSFVSYLRANPARVPSYLAKRMLLTFDSHKKLNTLLNYYRPLKIPPHAYLECYLRVRYNLNQDQLMLLLKGLIDHRWYQNVSVIIMENCRSFDEILEVSLKLMSLIEDRNDLYLGIGEFLIHYQSDAIVPQLLSLYELKLSSAGKFAQLQSLRASVALGRTILEKLTPEYLDQFQSLDDLIDDLEDLIDETELPVLVQSLEAPKDDLGDLVDDTELPVLVKLKIITAKIQYVKLKSAPNMVSVLDGIISNELVNDELMGVPGVLTRVVPLVSSMYPLTCKISGLLTLFSLSGSDLQHVLRFSTSLEELDRLYFYHEDHQIGDIGFIVGVLEKYQQFNETRAMLDILQNYEEKLPVYYIGFILILLRKNFSLFRKAMDVIDRSKHGYLLRAMGLNMCYQYSKCQNVSDVITFEELFKLVDMLKHYKVDHFPYLNPIFYRILLDERFLLTNKMDFQKNILRFASKSRVNVELLNEWNRELFKKFSATGNSMFINPVFTRKLIVRIMRLNDEDRRNKLLDYFGISLTFLNSGQLASFFNVVLNSINEETGRNVIRIEYGITMARRILYSYVRHRMSQAEPLEELFEDTLKFLDALKLNDTEDKEVGHVKEREDTLKFLDALKLIDTEDTVIDHAKEDTLKFLDTLKIDETDDTEINHTREDASKFSDALKLDEMDGTEINHEREDALKFSDALKLDEADTEIDHGRDVRTLIWKSNLKQLVMQLTTERDPGLGSQIIWDRDDTSLVKGHILGLLTTDKLSSEKKISKLRSTVRHQFFYKGKSLIGAKVLVNLVNFLIEEMKEGDVTSLRRIETFMWALAQCEKNGINDEFYRKWYLDLKEMKKSKRGFWSRRGISSV